MTTRAKKPRLLTIGAWLIYDNVYRQNVALVCSPRDTVRKQLLRVLPEQACKVVGETNFFDMTGNAGRCVSVHHPEHGHVTVIWLLPTIGVGVMAHEALHAVISIFSNKGIRLCDDSEEAFTYYLEWLMREMGERVWS